MSAAVEIKTMQLYNHLERFDRELVERGLAADGPLDAGALSAIDSMHYHGVKAVDEASARLGLSAGSTVLEIGSGLGGVVRRVAATQHCAVAGLELQQDVSAAADALTRRCGLANVEHICGDALAPPPALEGRRFGHVVSFLCFLHIEDTGAILKAAYDFLEPGGSLLVEDFYDRGLSAAEKAQLEAGQDKSAKFPTSKAPLSAAFHSLWLIFGRAIISRNGLEAWMHFPERARAEHSR